jgi:hypothetical protein
VIGDDAVTDAVAKVAALSPEAEPESVMTGKRRCRCYECLLANGDAAIDNVRMRDARNRLLVDVSLDALALLLRASDRCDVVDTDLRAFAFAHARTFELVVRSGTCAKTCAALVVRVASAAPQPTPTPCVNECASCVLRRRETLPAEFHALIEVCDSARTCGAVVHSRTEVDCDRQ